MSLKTLYCVSVVLCVLGSVVSVYSTDGQSGSPSEPTSPKASSQSDESQRLKRQQIRSLSENCPYECDCNPGTLQCSQSVTRGSLTEVPDRLGSFTKARQSKTLNFEGNSITRISDDDFFGLSQAKTLNLRHNQLTVVTPDAFEGLGSLRELSLDYNKIRDLPVDIFDPLVNLRVLDLSHNELTLDDPEDTPFLTSHGLQHIQTLDLSNNAIQALWDFTLAGLEQLTTLILDDNPLQDVRRNVFARTPSLQELSLVDVGLQPEVLLRELGNLPNLKRIHLGNGRDPCGCAWAKLKARLKKGGVVIVDQDAVSECGEGGLRVCVDTESKNAVRKDDAPNNNKAVKLSWKSVNYGPPSEKHSSAQNPPLEKGFNGYKPKKTTPSQLKDRLLHTEGKERVSSRTDTLPWRHPGKMKAPAQDRLYSNVASETSEKHSSAQIPPLEKGFNGYKPKKTTSSQLVNIVKDMLLHTEGKESVNSRTDTLPWRNIGKMKAPAQNDAQNKNKAVKLSWKSLNYSPPSEKHSSTQNPPLEKGFKGYKPKKTTSSQLVRIVKDRLLHTEGKERVRGTDTLPWRHPGKMKSPAQDRLYSKESVSSGTDALSWWHPGKMKSPAQDQLYSKESVRSGTDTTWWNPGKMKSPAQDQLYSKESVRSGTDTTWWNPGKMKSPAQDQLYSKESVSSGTDTLPWWNSGKMKAPAQVASEKSPASFPWWHPDYVRTSTFQGFGMMKSPMSENEVEPWWHPEYDSVHQARGQEFQFVPQKHPTSTGFYKTPERQSQTYGTPSRTGHRNAYNRVTSPMESYADVVNSLYGSPHRNGNYVRPNQYGRSGLQDDSRSRPAIGRPHYEDVHDKVGGTQHRKSGHSPTLSSYRTKYVHYDPNNDLYETRSRQVQNNPSQNDVDKKLQHHNNIKNILTEIKKKSNYVRPNQYGRSGLQDNSRSRPAIGRPLHEYVRDKDSGTQHRKSGHSPTVSSYRTKYVHYDPNNDLYETRSRQVQNNPSQNDVDKKVQHHNNIKNILTEIEKSSISLGGRKMLNYMGNGRKAGRHGSRKKGEQTDEMSQREHGRRGGNEWLYDLWKRKASEKAASERETALDDSQYLMKEEEEDFKRLREKVKKLRTKIHRMEELEEERREYGEKKQVSSKSKPKESEAPPDSRARRYMVPILLPFACVVVVLVIALVVKHLSSRRQGAQKEEDDDQCDWLTKFTKKAKKKVKRPIWALGRGEKQLKINRKQAMSLAGDQEDSEDEELFDVKEEKSVPFKAYRKSRQ